MIPSPAPACQARSLSSTCCPLTRHDHDPAVHVIPLPQPNCSSTATTTAQPPISLAAISPLSSYDQSTCPLPAKPDCLFLCSIVFSSVQPPQTAHVLCLATTTSSFPLLSRTQQ
ncbi:hypothetical protein ACFE04_026602 [Oxalis oulophora]